MPTLSVIIPIYNELATAETLIRTVLDLPLELSKDVIIVEGKSTDGTTEIVKKFEGVPGVRVVYETAPKGKGAAVRTGLGLVKGDIVLVQDGDLEYSPKDYARLLQPLLENKCDIVFGSRVREGSSEAWQFRRFAGFEKFYGFFVNLGGVLFTGLFNLLYGTKLTDGATMFKFFRAKDLKDITLKSDGFDYDWELSAKCAKKGLRFYELPVTYNARSRAQGKKIRFWRDGTRVLLAIVRYRFTD